MTDKNPRAAVLDILTEVLENGKFCHIVLRNKLAACDGFLKQDRAFITRMAQGTIEKCIELDYIINYFSKVKVKKMKPVIRNILRMSVYQIKYMDSVPDSAVCNEAVKLTAKRGYCGLKGFVNGVLRNIVREQKKCIIDDENFSVKYSVPEWIVNMWIKDYGKEKAESMLISSAKESKICIRRNTSKCSREDFLELMEKDSARCQPSEISEDIFYLSDIDRLNGMDTFRDGLFQVQDMSSAMAGYAASPNPEDICVDVCAAPGGKTIHIADLLNGTGWVYSRDISEEKVGLILENVERTGFSNIKAEVWDALKDDVALHGKADIVIADLPCSGLGVISKKPDIKYRVSAKDIEELSQLQRKILSIVSLYLKPGGKLIYSTCTVNMKENQENRKWIIENLPFEPESLEGKIPESIKYDSLKEGYMQIFPGDYGMDGFFVAAFKKIRKDIEV